MTAQANTADGAEATLQQTEQTTATREAGQQANPLSANHQASNQETTPEQQELDKQIKTAEKRATDKEAYLRELEDKLRDQDRVITEHKTKLGKSMPRLTEQAEEGASANSKLTGAQKDAAQNLGITGEQFINMLRDNPDGALAAVIEAAEKRAEQKILGQIPQHMKRYQIENDTMEKLNRIYEELGDNDFGIFKNTVAAYQQQGFAPTPDQIMNELRYGSTENQKALMEYALNVLQNKQAAASDVQNQTRQAKQPQQGMARPFPMAPGGTSPVMPQQGGNQQRTGNRLPETWNI